MKATAPSARGAVVFALACLVAACSGARDETTQSQTVQPPPAPRIRDTTQHIGWVGMFSPDLVAHLENENRLGELCKSAVDSVAFAQCRVEKLAPDSFTVQLRSGPSATDSVVGSLLMVGTPGKGLSAYFVKADGSAPAQIAPDMYDADWGYGPPYFHMTVAEFRDPWVRLPEVPFPKGTWLNTDDLSSTPITEWIEEGNIVTSPYGDLYVIRADSNSVTGRPQQPADMWCSPGTAPPIEPFDSIRVGGDSLYTPTGHLRLRIKYTRGC